MSHFTQLLREAVPLFYGPGKPILFGGSHDFGRSCSDHWTIEGLIEVTVVTLVRYVLTTSCSDHWRIDVTVVSHVLTTQELRYVLTTSCSDHWRIDVTVVSHVLTTQELRSQ
ncbi:hypothetical protein DPMN_073440 [Dreissena polymorpha]|uniref:Uncharacterized protein n=1 Tax=Dreissena polymorpha TaxID=45954 RepID=A0A9D4BZ27_DREPO|nr:hypothetical protein DPMN_073440 [Dreissena polymorpha]